MNVLKELHPHAPTTGGQVLGVLGITVGYLQDLTRSKDFPVFAAGLRRTDAIWERVRSNDTQNIPTFVSESSADLPEQPDFDVTVCGGTLGIFLATALQLKGLRVCILERGRLAGRAQEWNISRNELDVLVQLGVLTEAEIEEAIAVEFNPVRMQFKVLLPAFSLINCTEHSACQ